MSNRPYVSPQAHNALRLAASIQDDIGLLGLKKREVHNGIAKAKNSIHSRRKMEAFFFLSSRVSQSGFVLGISFPTTSACRSNAYDHTLRWKYR